MILIKILKEMNLKKLKIEKKEKKFNLLDKRK